MKVLAEASAPVADWQAGLPDELRAMIQQAAARNATEPSFNNSVAMADNEIALLLTQTKPQPAAALRIIDLYRAAVDGGASPWEVVTVQEYLDFLIAVGEGLPVPVLRALGEIRAAI